MVLLDPVPVQAWLDEHQAGERLVAFTRVMRPPNYEVSDMGRGGIGDITATPKLLGLDPANEARLLGGRAGLFVLTAAHFYVLRLGGLREKIKETLLGMRRSEVEFTAHDLVLEGRNFRHWVVTLPDGRYLLEPQILGKPGKPSRILPGSESFRTELGAQANYMGGHPA